MLNKAIWAVPRGRHVVPRGVQDKIWLTKKGNKRQGFCRIMTVCILYYILFLLLFPYLLFASLCTRISLSSLFFSLIRSLVSAISQSSLVTSIFNDQTAGTDSPVCSLRITTISPGVNALRLHGWHHPLFSYLFLVLFFYSANQPFSWCWCGPDI